jgi:hypothetical protein
MIRPLNLFTLTMEVTPSSEMFALTRATRRHIPEDGILNSYPHENINSYIWLYIISEMYLS